MNDIWVSLLQDHVIAGHINRRQFIKNAAVLGLSSSTISAALAACGNNEAPAETPAPAAGPTATKAPVTINQNASPAATTASVAAPTAAATKAAITPGGSVVFANQRDSTNMDPALGLNGNVDIWVFMNFYDQLIRVSEDGTQLVPSLAEQWSVSDDGLKYTFKIRKGVKFADGTPMTVEDIKWSLERARDSEKSSWTFTLKPVKEVTTPDASTVVLTLQTPWAPFLAGVAMFNASVVSRAYADKIGVDALADHTMGTGPFTLKEFKRGETITMVKNPNYWEQGLPYLDEITIKLVPDTNNEILQLQAGQVDGMIGQFDVSFNRVKDFEKDSNLQVLRIPSTFVNMIILNTRNAPLDDVKVRQALNHATDKQALIDTVLFGNAAISNSFMPRGAKYWNPDQEPYPYDIAKAKSLMQGSASPTGFKLEIQVNAGNQQQVQVATATKSMWAQIGVDLDIQQLDSGVVSSNRKANKFQTTLTGWTNDIIDPDQLVTVAVIYERSQSYNSGWQNQQAIDLAKRGETTLDDNERRRIYYEIQKIHKDDAPFVYLYVVPYMDILRKRVKGFVQSPMGHWVFKGIYVEK